MVQHGIASMAGHRREGGAEGDRPALPQARMPPPTPARPDGSDLDAHASQWQYSGAPHEGSQHATRDRRTSASSGIAASASVPAAQHYQPQHQHYAAARPPHPAPAVHRPIAHGGLGGVASKQGRATTPRMPHVEEQPRTVAFVDGVGSAVQWLSQGDSVRNLRIGSKGFLCFASFVAWAATDQASECPADLSPWLLTHSVALLCATLLCLALCTSVQSIVGRAFEADIEAAAPTRLLLQRASWAVTLASGLWCAAFILVVLAKLKKGSKSQCGTVYSGAVAIVALTGIVVLFASLAFISMATAESAADAEEELVGAPAAGDEGAGALPPPPHPALPRGGVAGGRALPHAGVGEQAGAERGRFPSQTPELFDVGVSVGGGSGSRPVYYQRDGGSAAGFEVPSAP